MALVLGGVCGVVWTWGWQDGGPPTAPGPLIVPAEDVPRIPRRSSAPLDPLRQETVDQVVGGDDRLLPTARPLNVEAVVEALPDGWFSVMRLDEAERQALVDAWANVPVPWAGERPRGAWLVDRNGPFSAAAVRAWVLENAEAVRACTGALAVVPGDLELRLEARRRTLYGMELVTVSLPSGGARVVGLSAEGASGLWAALPPAETRRPCALRFATFGVGEWTGSSSTMALGPIVVPDPRLR